MRKPKVASKITIVAIRGLGFIITPSRQKPHLNNSTHLSYSSSVQATHFLLIIKHLPSCINFSRSRLILNRTSY